MSNCLDYINTEKKIILIWSPKVACTTLHKWFVEDISNIKLDIDPRITAAKRNFIRKIDNYNNFKDYNIYFFIRNPIFRCISCFINKFVKYYDGRSLKNLESLEGFSIDLIRNYNPELIRNYKGITFNEFLNAIDIKSINLKDNQVNIKNFKNSFDRIKKIYETDFKYLRQYLD